MDVEFVINNLVAAGMKAKELDDAMQKAGYDSNPFFSIYGSIADAVYYMLGEETETFDKSVTYRAFNESMPDEQRAKILLDAYNKRAQS